MTKYRVNWMNVKKALIAFLFIVIIASPFFICFAFVMNGLSWADSLRTVRFLLPAIIGSLYPFVILIILLRESIPEAIIKIKETFLIKIDEEKEK